ncbi:MAG: prepilin-type N-terminal cleavage/methylation domain-containing protein [Patescibacteria group bacterium]|nr:prepilin-type N-terminal cleavage/methylation domain-containing protein [Patescibacteria group bacterium]
MRIKIFKPKEIKNQQGFTLVEMVVSAGLLVMLVMAVSGIYIQSMKTNKSLKEISLLQQEVQYIMESFTKKIRMSEINYDYYGGSVSGSVQELALIDEENKCLVYRLKDKTLQVAFGDESSCPEDPEDPEEPSVFTNLSSENLNIEALDFYIQPVNKSLMIMDFFQPRVTISMRVQIKNNEPEILVQETIPQRFTERK